MPELAEVFARYGPAYLHKYGPAMLSSHRRAMRDIVRCRTASMGGQVFRCHRCGHTHYVYHSCRNRHCPKCHHQQTEDWLEQRRQELLPIPCFHVVFTVPDELHACLRSQQTPLYAILMKAAAQATIRLAADPHYVGGLVGVMAVLHTWGRNLQYHPHVHCLVTGGGVNRATQEWRAARSKYLVPVKALSCLFRDTFKELAAPWLGTNHIPEIVWKMPWVVNCQPVRGHVDHVLNYLARYVHRIAITNNRIPAIGNGQVTFQYRDTRDQQCRQMTVSAEEFIRRFLQHVLPRGFHKVRYYGLWAPGKRALLRQLQWLLTSHDRSSPLKSGSSKRKFNDTEDAAAIPVCPSCGQPTLVLVGTLHPYRRGPP